MKEPVSEAWLTNEALKIAGNLLDAHLERDASVIHQLVRRVRQGSPTLGTAVDHLAGEVERLEVELEAAVPAEREACKQIAKLETELARANAELELRRLNAGWLERPEAGNARIAELEAEVARLTKVSDQLAMANNEYETKIAELEAEAHRVWEALDRCPLEFGRIIVKHTNLDPDDTWRAIIDPILYPPERPAP